jgi:hypothetical protein
MKTFIATLRRKKIAIAGAALALACSAGVAHADDSADQSFLSLLAGQGITGHDKSTLVATGKGVCQELSTTGRSPSTIGAEILSMGRLSGPTDSLADPEKAGFLVLAAIAVYCPQFKPLVGH